MSYLGKHGTRRTPQSQPLPGRPEQVANNAGGFVWEVDPWQRLNRFLILGSEGGSYYASEHTLSYENVQCVRQCVADDGGRTVAATAAISTSGRAVRNDPALYTLAVCISLGDKPTKRLAAEALPVVARTGTDLYRFIAFAETMRGWGRTLRWAVSNWYSGSTERLALQAIKYRQRNGWTHRDALRLAHRPYDESDTERNRLLEFITHPENAEGYAEGMLMPQVEAFLAAQNPNCSAKQAAALVEQFRLPREALKTEHLQDADVWRALLRSRMPMRALIRNLATMTRLGVLAGREERAFVLRALSDQDAIRSSRLHPMSLLVALRGYAQGSGLGGSRTWSPLPSVIDALDEAFYLAFGNVEPTNKATMLAVDVSASMGQGSVAGAKLTPREAAAALVMVAMHTETEVACVGISNAAYALPISKRQRLDDVTRLLASFPASSTDLSLPYTAAIEHLDSNWKPEVFQVITDHETWRGGIHPTQALQVYRQRSGVDARSIGVAMVANAWSMHDPNDPLTLDVVGFDSETPTIIAEFSAGRI